MKWTEEWGEDFYNEEEDEDIPDFHQKTNFCILVDILLALIVVK